MEQQLMQIQISQHPHYTNTLVGVSHEEREQMLQME